MRLASGDMVLPVDGDYVLIERELCEALYFAGYVRMCGDPACSILHLHDDCSARDIEQVKLLVGDAKSV